MIDLPEKEKQELIDLLKSSPVERYFLISQLTGRAVPVEFILHIEHDEEPSSTFSFNYKETICYVSSVLVRWDLFIKKDRWSSWANLQRPYLSTHANPQNDPPPVRIEREPVGWCFYFPYFPEELTDNVFKTLSQSQRENLIVLNDQLLEEGK